jgi:hypothetical protein
MRVGKAARVLPSEMVKATSKASKASNAGNVVTIGQELYQHQSLLLKRIQNLEKKQSLLKQRLSIHRKQFGNYVDKAGCQKVPAFKQSPPMSPNGKDGVQKPQIYPEPSRFGEPNRSNWKFDRPHHSQDSLCSIL